MCVEQTVALQQLVFKIQYELPRCELLRNLGSQRACVTGLNIENAGTGVSIRVAHDGEMSRE